MSYTVKNTQGKLVSVVEDGTLNNDTSLTLVGIGRNDYSETIAEDFVRLMENFCSIYEPVNPVQGQLYFDNNTDINRLKVFDGNRFGPINNVSLSSTSPALPAAGDLWYDIANEQLKYYNPSTTSWTVVAPVYTKSQGETGLIVDTLYDVTRNAYTVNRIMVNNAFVAILANDNFQPFPSIQGFDYIRPGINLINTGVISGTVQNSLQFQGRWPNSFMYSNSDTSTTGSISILNDSGLNLGYAGTFIANVSRDSQPGVVEDVNLINTNALGVINLTVTNNLHNPVNTLQVTPDGDINVLNHVYANGGIFGNVSVLNELDVNNDINLTGDLNLLGAGNINAGGNVNISSDLHINGNIISASQTTGTTFTTTCYITGTSTIGTVVTNSNTQMVNSSTGTLLNSGAYVGELPTQSVFFKNRNISVAPGASLVKGNKALTVNDTAVYAQGDLLVTGNLAVGTGTVDLGTIQIQGITGTPAPGSNSTISSGNRLYITGSPYVRTNQLYNDTQIFTQTLVTADTTDTTGVNTGSVQIIGGASITKGLYVGGTTSLAQTTLNGIVTEKINYQRLPPSPALQGTETINLVNGANYIYPVGTAGAWSPNFVWDSSTSLNSKITYQQSFTVNIIVVQRSVSFNTSSVFIDGNAQTVYWLGYVPTVASLNSIDSYNYFITKQAENDWIVMASTSNFVSS
jgi:hypothetical protein